MFISYFSVITEYSQAWPRFRACRGQSVCHPCRGTHLSLGQCRAVGDAEVATLPPSTQRMVLRSSLAADCGSCCGGWVRPAGGPRAGAADETLPS